MTTPKYRDDRPVIYVSGPMTATDGWMWEKNIRRAEEVGFELVFLGAAVVVPQTADRFFRGSKPTEVCLEVDFALLKRCDALVTVAGWENSGGAGDELEYCDQQGIPKRHLPPLPWDRPVREELKVWIEGMRREASKAVEVQI